MKITGLSALYFSLFLALALVLTGCGKAAETIAENIPDDAVVLTSTESKDGEHVPISMADSEGNVYDAPTGEIIGHIDLPSANEAVNGKDETAAPEAQISPDNQTVAEQAEEQETQGGVLNLVVSEFATPMQQKFYEALSAIGFSMTDVTSLNEDLYPGNIVISGNIKISFVDSSSNDIVVSAICVAGNPENANDTWFELYSQGQTNGNHVLYLGFLPENPNGQKTIKLLWNGKYTRADFDEETFIAIYTEASELETYIDNLFANIDDIPGGVSE